MCLARNTKRSCRQRIARAIVAIGVGLVCTVGLSWILAATIRVCCDPFTIEARSRRPDSGEGSGFLVVSRNNAFGSAFLESSLWSADDLAGQSTVDRSDSTPEAIVPDLGASKLFPWSSKGAGWPEYGGRCIEARGWPFLALCCTVVPIDNTSGASAIPIGASIEGGVEIAAIRMPRGLSGFDGPAALPYRPIWRGVVKDTVILGAAWWLAGWACRITRSRCLRRAGRCPDCAYDLRDTAVDAPCPECGTPPRRRPAMPAPYTSPCLTSSTPPPAAIAAEGVAP